MSSKKPYNVVLMGTPDFSLTMFEEILNCPDFKVKAIVTQVDKPVGRKQVLTAPPVKELGLKYGIEVKQVNKIKDIADYLNSLNLDLIIVIAYGKILPQSILDIPKEGCINVHASLLPKYRGASCLQAPILAGDETSGLTIMKMDAGMDTGDIIKQFEIKLDKDETLTTLHDKLSSLGGGNIVETLLKYLLGDIKEKKQAEEKATYVKLIKKEDGILDFSNTSETIIRNVRALNPWPGTFAFLGEKILKILEIQGKIENNQPHKIGELFFNSKQLYIQTKDKAIEISKLQVSGKKAVEQKEIYSGYRYLEGKILTKVPSSSG